MKRLKITESQAILLKKLGASKKKLKLTSEQFNRLCEATVGAKGVVKNFKQNAKSFGVPPNIFKEGIENDIDPNELKKEVISLLKNALSGADVKEIPPVLQSMGISLEDINNLADDKFMNTSIVEKKNIIDEFVNEIINKQTMIKEEGSEPIKNYHLLSNLNLPDTRDEVDWKSGPTYLIDDITDGDAKSVVRDKEFFIGRTFTTRIGKVVKQMGYIKNFAKKFGELPLFQIDGNNIKVVNPKFLEWQSEYTKAKAGVLDKWGTTESTSTGSVGGSFVAPVILQKNSSSDTNCKITKPIGKMTTSTGGSPSEEMNSIISDSDEEFSEEDVMESTGASSNATYDAPGFAPTKKGTKVGPYKQNIDIYQTNKLTKTEGVDNTTNLDATSWPDGEFVDFDDCVKLNNNKVAQNGGCSQGDSGVVKLKKTKKSIISNQKG